MSESKDCLKRFQTAVDVIQSLPKNGSYRPSYETMLRFYGLYKQAICGPCTVSRPGFWDPVGRYKWEAWKHLGDMSRETAMAAYVNEMKKVAQEVIDTMDIDEKTASYFHYFEPLYHVIHDMPRPPGGIVLLGSGQVKSEGSDCDVFCDTLEQLDTTKIVTVLPAEDSRFQDHHSSSETSGTQGHNSSTLTELIQLEAGCGAEERERDWRDTSGERGDAVRRSDTQTGPQSSRADPGEGGRAISEHGPNKLLDAHVQQQIILALWQLREDMQRVMERLDVVEGLASANAHNSRWRSCLELTAEETEEEWWPFEISGPSLLLLAMCPFVARALSFLLRWKKGKNHGCI